VARLGKLKAAPRPLIAMRLHLLSKRRSVHECEHAAIYGVFRALGWRFRLP
jgi:hypothetical protein